MDNHTDNDRLQDPATTTAPIKFDATNFLILSIRCETFNDYLKSNHTNASQFATLLKLSQDAYLGNASTPSELAAFLNVTSAAATQTANALESRGLIERHAMSGDARAKTIRISPKGEEFLARSDRELHEWLSTVFTPATPEDGAMFEAGLRIGARVGDHWLKETIERLPHATNLVAVNLFLRQARNILKETAAVTVSEGRLLQLLWEQKRPLRIVKAAQRLKLPSVTVTQAAQRLTRNGLVERLATPENRKAIYLTLTNQGEDAARAIEAALFKLGDDLYWGKLSEKEEQATRTIRETTIRALTDQERETAPKDLAPLPS